MSLISSLKNLFGKKKNQQETTEQIAEDAQNLAEPSSQMKQEVNEQIQEALPEQPVDETDKSTE